MLWGNWGKKLKVLVAIWCDRYPRPETHRSLIEKLGCILAIVACLPSLTNLFPEPETEPHSLAETNQHSLLMDLYVLGWAAVLSVLLFETSHCPWFAFSLAAYRAFDIVSYRSYFLLVKSHVDPWTPKKLRRSVLIASVNFFEIVLAFAVMYRASSSVAQNNDLNPLLLTPRLALYFSLVTMTTVGYGDYVPAGHVGRTLAALQLTTVVLFLVFLLPALVSAFSAELFQGDQGLDSEKKEGGRKRS
jgi:preprotein translocase subunit SecG